MKGKNLKVAFRADGSNEKGLGHIVRCFALSQAFMDSDIRFYCTQSAIGGIGWLRQHNCRVEQLYSKTIEGESEEFNNLLYAWSADIVIVDSYWISSEYIRNLSQSGAIVVAIDDNGLYDYRCDAVINCNLGAENLVYPNAQISLLGGRYAMLRKEFTEISPTPPRERVSDILVTMGGADISNFTPTVLEALSSLRDINIHVVIGALMTNESEIKSAAEKCLCNVILHRAPKSMAELMASCDLAVSAGGGTVKELLAMGLVSLFIIQADNQMNLVEYMNRVNLPLCLGVFNEVTSEQIYSAACNLMNDYKLRTKYSTFMQEQVDRLGTKNIVIKLKEYYKKFI